MDILNFISWIKGGRQVTSVTAARTLLPVGLKDDRRDDQYLAGAISVSDFTTQLGGPVPQTLAATGGTLNVPFASGNIVNITLTASTTLTFTSSVIGTYILKLTQGGAGSYTITWPASVKWSGATAPTLTTTVGKSDIITLFYDGTNYFGTFSLNY